MKKGVKFILSLLIIIFIVIAILVFKNNSMFELKAIKSDKQLYSIYNHDREPEFKEKVIRAFCMPYSFLQGLSHIDYDYEDYGYNYNNRITPDSTDDSFDVFNSTETQSDSTDSSSKTKDYSTTNIQVENVDEADITKTDGDYIYSISEENVIITDVREPKDAKIVAKISDFGNSNPEDLMLYKNKLVVISASNVSSSYYSSKSNTIVNIYDISSKEKPVLEKSMELYEPYYTSRCINNSLYIIATGSLRKKDKEDKVLRSYKEDNNEQEIELKDIKYLKDINTTKQTLISVVNLDEPKEKASVKSYLMDISNAYVSENNIYLADEEYEYDETKISIKSLFGIGGVIGYFRNLESNNYENSGTKTKVFKFSIEKNGQVSYKNKCKTNGKIINQYSLDEKNNHLRMALYDNDGTRVEIFDENLNKIGSTSYVAKGEKMYSSRFIGDKAYLVTYKTIDPLFVVDLSNERSPKVLGELKIPGYSTYLHPYDENHIIGIGMETKETVSRNNLGKVTSTTSRIIGMKMALFDVSDVNNPKQISQTVIGDSNTTSAILTNPKALLFSKEKELIAIPVNNYKETFVLNSSSDEYTSIINSYKNYNKTIVAEGYLVYKINLTEGFNLKGVITHEKTYKSSNYYSSYAKSKLLRGLYIDNNLYTVSEDALKVNDLNSLDLIKEIKIKGVK